MYLHCMKHHIVLLSEWVYPIIGVHIIEGRTEFFVPEPLEADTSRLEPS